MNAAKLKWVIALGLLLIILIGTLAWQMVKSPITTQAEAQLQQTLRELKLQDKIKWESLTASPFGTLTLNQARFEYSPDAAINIKQMLISDVIDNAQRQRIRIQLKQAKTELSTIDAARMPPALFNPVDVDVQLDLNFSSNQAQFIYKSQQADVADMDFQLNLSEIGALRGILATVFPQSSAAQMELDPNFIGLNRLVALYSISLNSLDSRFKNRGLIEQLTRELKQPLENVPNNSSSGSIKQAREEAFLKTVQEIQQECHRRGGQALKQPCQALADMVLGKQQSLHLTVKPEKPVALQQLDALIHNAEMEEIVRLLNIHLK